MELFFLKHLTQQWKFSLTEHWSSFQTQKQIKCDRMSRQINCMQVFKTPVPASSSSALIHQYTLPSASPQTVAWWRQCHWLWLQCSVLVEHPGVQVNVFTKPLFQRKKLVKASWGVSHLVQSDLDLWHPARPRALWRVHASIYFFFILPWLLWDQCPDLTVLVFFSGGGRRVVGLFLLAFI